MTVPTDGRRSCPAQGVASAPSFLATAPGARMPFPTCRDPGRPLPPQASCDDNWVGPRGTPAKENPAMSTPGARSGTSQWKPHDSRPSAEPRQSLMLRTILQGAEQLCSDELRERQSGAGPLDLGLLAPLSLSLSPPPLPPPPPQVLSPLQILAVKSPPLEASPASLPGMHILSRSRSKRGFASALTSWWW